MHKRAQSGSEVTLVPGSASVASRAGLIVREMDGGELSSNMNVRTATELHR